MILDYKSYDEMFENLTKDLNNSPEKNVAKYRDDYFIFKGYNVSLKIIVTYRNGDSEVIFKTKQVKTIGYDHIVKEKSSSIFIAYFVGDMGSQFKLFDEYDNVAYYTFEIIRV
jgi:hypothetical protein